MKDWILEDIADKIDPSQYGARKGSGTEHLIVAFVDRVLKNLDSVTSKAAVISAAVDWSAAFDRLDPTITTLKLIKIGVRPSLVSILVSYMTNRRMIVKYKGVQSNPKKLIGGGPQGTLLGGLEYIVANDCSKDDMDNKDTFNYFDDLHLQEFLIFCDQLVNYDFIDHVASDIGTDHLFLPAENYNLQSNLDKVSEWTNENLMLLNETKCSYIIYFRSKSEFCTRLKINNVLLERKSVIKVLGVWLQEDLKWDYNTKQIVKKAYSRMYILNKLKYAGINQNDLLTIYKLFVRSICEYCSVVFHTSLTQEQNDKLEAIQSTALKIILAEKYSDYKSALKYFSIDTLAERRYKHMLKFSIKCTKDAFNQNMFPKNANMRGKDTYQVNFARTSQYLNSAVPQCQRALNAMTSQKQK